MRKGKSIALLLFYSLSLIGAILLPLIIWRLNLPIIQSTFDGSVPGHLESQPFELFGLFITIVLVGNTWHKISKQPKKTLIKAIPVILPLLVCLNLLFVQVETFHVRSSDYMCYENAARAIITGVNPYTGNPPCYLYPPLLAQILVFLHQIATSNPLFAFTDEDKAWTTVTYFYQCGQFLQVILAYYLTTLLAKQLKIKTLPASLLVGGLFLCNYPLIRTLTFDQVNLWLLNSFLLGILLLQRYPFFAGLAVALGAHIKLYTLVLLLPWGYTRRWKAICGVAIGLVAIIIIQTNGFHDWTLWQQFLSYFQSPEKPSNYRNNGIWSLIYNFAKIPNTFLGTDFLFDFVPVVVVGLNFLILAWLILRLLKREQIYSKLIKTSGEGQRNSWLYSFRLYGHSIDAIAFSLLISPSVWEHHYVLAIPLVLWAIANYRANEFWLTFLGAFLMFCVPTFEIFPLSFHRLIGLLILIYTTNPEYIRDSFFNSMPKPRHSFLQS